MRCFSDRELIIVSQLLVFVSGNCYCAVTFLFFSFIAADSIATTTPSSSSSPFSCVAFLASEAPENFDRKERKTERMKDTDNREKERQRQTQGDIKTEKDLDRNKVAEREKRQKNDRPTEEEKPPFE